MVDNVNGSFGNCIHGVSQQSDLLMFKGQAKEQINVRNNLTRGLEKRAAFRYKGTLMPDTANGGALANAKWFFQNNGDGKRFLIALDETRPAIFNVDSEMGEINAQPFTFEDGSQTYYQDSLTDPKTQFGKSTILDTTFLTNRNVVPEGDDANDNITDPTHVVYLRFKTFNPGVEIQITWGNGSYSYSKTVFAGFVQVNVDSSGNQTPSSSDTGRTKEYSGAFHAAAMGALTGATAYNYFVRLEGTYAENVKIVKGGDYIELIDNQDIESIATLPPFAETGDVCVVQEGKDEESNVTYFEASRKGGGSGFGEVTWSEIAAPGSSGVLLRETMPHVLKRDTSDNFTLSQYSWRDRMVGDYNSNPYPSFVTEKSPIQDIGIFQNKLFLSAGEKIIASATDVYEDLWKESAAYVTDADPFEVFANTEDLNIIKFSSQLDGDLIVFSANGQFFMSGETVQTYATASLDAIGSYKSDLNASPVASGKSIFFATNYGNFAGLREFYTDAFTDNKRADSITDHVNAYIPGRISHIASSTNLDVLGVLNDSNPDTLWVYQWRYEKQEKQQSAWCKWQLCSQDENEEFAFEWAQFLDSEFYAVVRHTVNGETNYELWVMDWDDPPGTHGLGFSVRLDGQFTIDAGDLVYDEIKDRTEVPTPYQSLQFTMIDGADSSTPGFDNYAYRDEEDGKWYIKGEITNSLIAGTLYRGYHQFPRPVPKGQDEQPMNLDRLQVSHINFTFSLVGEIEFIVGQEGVGEIGRESFNNRSVNRYNNLPSYIPYEGDEWFPAVRERAKELTIALESWSYVGFIMIAAEWRGKYIGRTKRI